MPYNDEKLQLLAYLPQLIGVSIAAASKSGLIGTGKELYSATRTIIAGASYFPNSALIKQLVPDPASGAAAFDWARKSGMWIEGRLDHQDLESPDRLQETMLDACTAASRVLATNASQSETVEYLQWALSVAESVASVASNGGILGIGGERFSPGEKELVARIEAAFDSSKSSNQVSSSIPNDDMQ